MFKKSTKYLSGVVAGVTASIGTASAAVPAGVTTALGDAATDVTTVGGLALIAVLSGTVFKYMRRAL